jgi:hypothetical protein
MDAITAMEAKVRGETPPPIRHVYRKEQPPAADAPGLGES